VVVVAAAGARAGGEMSSAWTARYSFTAADAAPLTWFLVQFVQVLVLATMQSSSQYCNFLNMWIFPSVIVEDVRFSCVVPLPPSPPPLPLLCLRLSDIHPTGDQYR